MNTNYQCNNSSEVLFKEETMMVRGHEIKYFINEKGAKIQLDNIWFVAPEGCSSFIPLTFSYFAYNDDGSKRIFCQRCPNKGYMESHPDMMFDKSVDRCIRWESLCDSCKTKYASCFQRVSGFEDEVENYPELLDGEVVVEDNIDENFQVEKWLEEKEDYKFLHTEIIYHKEY